MGLTSLETAAPLTSISLCLRIPGLSASKEKTPEPGCQGKRELFEGDAKIFAGEHDAAKAPIGGRSAPRFEPTALAKALGRTASFGTARRAVAKANVMGMLLRRFALKAEVMPKINVTRIGDRKASPWSFQPKAAVTPYRSSA